MELRQLRDAEPALTLLLYLHTKEESLKVEGSFHFFIKQPSEVHFDEEMRRGESELLEED